MSLKAKAQETLSSRLPSKVAFVHNVEYSRLCSPLSHRASTCLIENEATRNLPTRLWPVSVEALPPSKLSHKENSSPRLHVVQGTTVIRQFRCNNIDENVIYCNKVGGSTTKSRSMEMKSWCKRLIDSIGSIKYSPLVEGLRT